MKKEILEKIRNIIVNIFVLFIFILIMLITFVSLRVHAAESSYSHKYTLTWTHTVSTWKYPETRLCVYSSDAPFVIVRQESNVDGVYVYYVKAFIQNSNYPNGILVNLNDSLISGKFDWDVFYTKDNVTTEFHNQTNQLWSSHTTRKDVYSDGNISESTVEADFPIFDSNDHALAYCKNGSTEGLLNGGSIDNPDFQDTAYAFTGFTANSKMTATWTGTTERSYLKDEDVEEYVRVSYGFAAKDAPDSIKQVDNDSKEYSTAAKSLTVKVSDLVPDDDSWFLRYVQVIPCYRQAGLGVWGDFYHGVACKVYFNQDGSIDKIVRDFPQGSGDYSYKHIFSSDKYSNEIPAPELSAISRNGFTLLNNSNNDYYVDIILESNLYGVKMEKNAGTWLPVVDTDWIYNSHYYNFADTSQIAINNDVIYIPNLFSVNPESDLVDDFKKWSSEYSSYSSLPSMSFLKRSTAARTRYVDQFLFKDNSKYSDSEQLRFSHMAESVFYVRYYNKSMVYGPWVRYKFRDGYVAQVIDGTLGGAYIDVGQVDTDDSGNVRVDENGNPIVSDNVSGRQDYDTGESDFSDGSFSLDLSDVTKFFDYLKKIFESVTGALSSFGSVVAACFGFLPGELVNALIFGICVMMFIGIIKAVKG